MISKSKIKFIQSLHQKKFRKQENLFLLEGDKMAREALEHPLAKTVYALQGWVDQNQEMLRRYLAEVVVINERELKAISTLKTPNQVLLIMQQPGLQEAVIPNLEGYHLYLDQIQDPGNMGTILRTADWFGISSVCCSEGCADVFNPKVVQASMGAILRVKVFNYTLAELLEAQPDLPVYGTLLAGTNMYTTERTSSGLIVIGNEGRGISEENKGLITHKVTIPKGRGGGAESLNAAVAAGIVCSYFCQ